MARQVRVIYVHGVGDHPPEAQLKLDWDLALFGRDMQARTMMAYWSDVPHEARRAAGGVKAAALTRAAEQDALMVEADRPDRSPEALVDEAGVPARNKAAARVYARRLHRLLRGYVPMPGRLRATGLDSKVLPVPEWIRRRITEAIARLFIRDTAAYFYHGGKKRAMQGRLRAALEQADGPVVLVSHSLGSIIAYEVLAAWTGRTTVPLWVTVGSPLGLQEVQDHVVKPLARPACVDQWRNFADLLDPIALDKRLHNDFGDDPRITDAIVVNADSTRLVGFHPHSSIGYLMTDEVRQAVAASTGEAHDPLVFGGFFRRDVLHAMRDRLSRHSVLIELRDRDAFGAQSETDTLSVPDGPSMPEKIRKFDEARRTARRRKGAPPHDAGGRLAMHRDALVEAIHAVVGECSPARSTKAIAAVVDEAAIDPLRRFVAARLTTAEMQVLALNHGVHIYCVWKNQRKRKLIARSAAVVHAPAARIAYRAEGDGITWAVLDTGVAARHPHFAALGTIDEIWDCTRPGPPRRIALDQSTDPDGHGTHVCGILAGEEGAGPEDRRGLAPRAKLRVYRVLDETGDGVDGWIIKALDHIAETNERASDLAIHGVNVSLGGPFDEEVYGCGHTPLCQELRRLWRQGVLVCVACGNDGQIVVNTPDGEFSLKTQLSVGDPANLEECIAVGSVNADRPHSYGISYFSSRGPTADGRAKPDVVAPGERITSCASSDFARRPYVAHSGTSMACPHVSGVLASFLSVRREFIGRPDEVKRLLLEHCTDIGRDRYHQGRGIPNLMRMLGSS